MASDTFNQLPSVYRDPAKWPVYIASVWPPDIIYFLPNGSKTRNEATGETTELAPGYYGNPRRLGVITNIE